MRGTSRGRPPNYATLDSELLKVLRGKPPPRKSVQQGIADLDRRIARDAAKRQARFNEENKLLAKVRAPLIDIVRKDQRAVQAMHQIEKLHKRRKLKLPLPTFRRRQPRVRFGSLELALVPPYNWGYGNWGTGKSGALNSAANANGDPNAGLLSVGTDGNAWAAAGVGSYFYPAGYTGSATGGGNQSVWFTALLGDLSYNWYDQSTGLNASSSGYLNLFLQPYDNAGNLVTEDVQEMQTQLWQNSTSGYDSNSNAGGPVFTSVGPMNFTTPLLNDFFYLLWATVNVQSWAANGLLAWSNATIQLQAVVDWIIVNQGN